MNKKLRYVLSVITAAAIFAGGALNAYASAAQKNDLAIVMRALINFANVKTYDISGEMTVYTKTNILGSETEDKQTMPVTGAFADGGLTLYGEDGAETGGGPLTGLLRGVERSMLENLVIIDDFAKDGVRYLDVFVLDFTQTDGVNEDFRDFITDSLSFDEDAGLSAAFRELIPPLIGSLSLEGIQYFRIDTKARKVAGIGLNVSIGTQFDLVDTPISIYAEAEAYIEVIENTEAAAVSG